MRKEAIQWRKMAKEIPDRKTNQEKERKKNSGMCQEKGGRNAENKNSSN